MFTRKGFAILAGLVALALPAMARDFGFSFNYDRGERCYSRPVVYDCYRPATVYYSRPVCYERPVTYYRESVCYDRPSYRSSSVSFSYRDRDCDRPRYRSRSVRVYRR
ncbi:MAG: hypothetical protein ACKVS9_08020 [Phycisphaerae bacterium]